MTHSHVNRFRRAQASSVNGVENARRPSLREDLHKLGIMAFFVLLVSFYIRDDLKYEATDCRLVQVDLAVRVECTKSGEGVDQCPVVVVDVNANRETIKRKILFADRWHINYYNVSHRKKIVYQQVDISYE